MRVLLIKTSSMGDLIHTLPALTDAGKAIPGIIFDWVVEESYADLPKWHPLVDRVIPISLRRWRKQPIARTTFHEWRALRALLAQKQYDLILDAQGLVKSAFLTYATKGVRAGLDFQSAREGLASFAYQRKCKVNFYQHAVMRMRLLFSQALHYPLSTTLPDFGISQQQFQTESTQENYLVFLHGTAWATKEWPESYWVQLARFAEKAGYRVKVSGYTQEEVARAQRIANQSAAVHVMPRLNLTEMAALLAGAKAVISVDTGFGHLAAALNVPTVSMYGPTNPDYTGALGQRSQLISADFPCAPCLSRSCQFDKKHPKQSAVFPACFGSIPPLKVWSVLQQLVI